MNNNLELVTDYMIAKRFDTLEEANTQADYIDKAGFSAEVIEIRI